MIGLFGAVEVWRVNQKRRQLLLNLKKQAACFVIPAVSISTLPVRCTGGTNESKTFNIGEILLVKERFTTRGCLFGKITRNLTG